MLPLLTLVATGSFAAASILRARRRGRAALARKQAQVARGSSFSVLEHQQLTEEAVVLAAEDVPLDNRFGNKTFVSEHDFSRTAVVSMELESGRQLDSLSRFGFFETMKADLQTRLSQDLEVEIGSQLSRSVRVRFSAAPGEKVRYRLTWKQNIQRGLFKVAVGGKVHEIPYLVSYGLSHVVESLSVEENEVS